LHTKQEVLLIFTYFVDTGLDECRGLEAIMTASEYELQSVESNAKLQTLKMYRPSCKMIKVVSLLVTNKRQDGLRPCM